MAEPLQALATRFVSGSRSTWECLVKIAASLKDKQVDIGAKRLAEYTGTDHKNVKMKIKAIRAVLASGKTAEEIIKEGQHGVLVRVAKERKRERARNGEELVCFPHKLTPGCRDAFKETTLRLAKTLGLKTYDQVIDFINADYATTTDEELHHKAGNGNAKYRKTRPIR